MLIRFILIAFVCLASLYGQGQHIWNIYPRTQATPTVGELRFLELNSNGSNYVGFKAPPNITANKVWQMPAVDGSAGQMLKTNGSMVLDWATPGNAPWVNVKDYGAVGDGASHAISTTTYTIANFPNVPGVAATDEIDWAAAQEALYSRPASGGCVWMPTGTYIFNKTLQLGNGADQTAGDNVNTRESTKNGQCLFGDGSGHANNSPTITGPTVIKSAAGFTTGPLIQVSGNTYDTLMWGFVVDGGDITAKGIVLRSSYQGRFRNIQVRRVTGTAWRNEKRVVNSIQICEYSSNAAGCITLANAYKFRDAPCLNNFSMISSELPSTKDVIGFDLDTGCSNTIEDSSFYYGGGTGSYGVKLRFADNNMFRRVNVDRTKRISNGGIYGDAVNTAGYWGFREGFGLYLQSATEDPRMPYENQFIHFVTAGQGIGATTTNPQSGQIGNLFITSPGDCDGTSATDLCNGGDILGIHLADTWGNYWAGWKFRRGINVQRGKTGDVAGFYQLSGYFGMPNTFVPNETVPAGAYANGTAGQGWTFNAGATRIYLMSAADQQAGMVIQAFNGNVAFNKGVTSRGTLVAPAALLDGDPMYSVGGTGHDGVGFPIQNAAAVTFNAAQNWSNVAHGSEIRFEVTPIGSTSSNRKRAVSIRTANNSPEVYFIDAGTNNLEGGIRYNTTSSTMQFRHSAAQAWTDFNTSASGSGLYYGFPGSCTPTTTAYDGTFGCGFTIDKAGQSNANATVMHIQSSASQSAGLMLTAFGGNVPFIKMAGIGGTVAAPSVTGTGAPLANYGGVGWAGSGTLPGSNGAMTINTTQSFASGYGTEIRMETTPDGMTARRRTAAFQSVCTSISGSGCIGNFDPYLWFINGGTNNRVAGFRYSVGTTKLQFSHDGSVWTDLGGAASGGYATIQDEGGALFARTTLNFTGTGVTCSDDSAFNRTNCSITTGAGGVDWGNVPAHVYPSLDNVWQLGSSTRRWALVVATGMQVQGSNVAVLDTSGTLRSAIGQQGFYAYNALGQERVHLDPNDGLMIRNSSSLPVFSVDTAGNITAPSGSPGLTSSLNCPAGQAIKQLTVSGGIVTNASCGIP